MSPKRPRTDAPDVREPLVHQPPPPPPRAVPEDPLARYLRSDPEDPTLVAEFPCEVARQEPDRWRAFEAALRERHAAERPGAPLLRQQNLARTTYAYRTDPPDR